MSKIVPFNPSTSTRRALVRPWKSACKRACVSGHPFKSCRDSFATLALNAGVRITVVSRQLGHSSTTITERHYAAVTPKFIAAEIEKTDQIDLRTR